MPIKPRAYRGGRVYVATDGNKIKVGMSARGKCLTRFYELKKVFGFQVVDSFITERRFDYRIIEKMAHQKLAAFRLHNEFFSAPYEDGVQAVKEAISELDSHGFIGSAYPFK
jgi:ABC-type antimicrobial peptide transport system permease subunit